LTGEKETESKSNLERLRAHLKKDSLADRLVAARIKRPDDADALGNVIKARIEELRRKHDPVPDQQA
jgi:hypothetical protein